jgi:hypothetical protein
MITYRLTTRYLDAEGTIDKAQFGSGDLALMFCTDEDPPMRLNTNMAGEGIITPPDHIWVKTYSEHEGLPEALVLAGICTFAEVPDLAGRFDSQWILMRVLI